MNIVMTHAELVQRAARWLMNTRRCGIVITETGASRILDIPDAVGWLDGRYCIVVECKTSISDYYADKKKSINQHSPYGAERWYLCERGVLEPKRIRDGWGLLWAYPKQIRRKLEAPILRWSEERARIECQLLYSVAHRLWAHMNSGEPWGLRRIHICPLNAALMNGNKQNA